MNPVPLRKPVMSSGGSEPAAPRSPRTPVPFFDAARQVATCQAEIQAALERVLRSGRFILGAECEQFEAALAEQLEFRYAVSCASGSDALLLILMALGIGPGDEVIVPSYSFFATAGVVSRLGARPVFVDIDPRSCNISVDQVAQFITPRTRAILPVHLFGQCADMLALRELADSRRIPVVEDVAQAIGARCHDRPAGSWGVAGAFSFFPTKNLGALGDGGAVLTNDEMLRHTVQRLRVHGMQPRHYHTSVGINSRLDALQAAVLSAKLPHLAHWTRLRRAHAERYTAAFHSLADRLETPVVLPDNEPVWNQYVLRVADGRRDALQQHLAAAGIGSEVYYPRPLPEQPCYRELGGRVEDYPHALAASRETLALPVYAELTEQEQGWVIDAVNHFFDVH